LVEAALAIEAQRALVVLRDLEHEVRAAAHAREVLELLEHERSDAAPLIVGVRRELLHEERPHVARLEEARIDPVIRSGDLERALCIADDLAVDGEHELLDPVVVVLLEEALLAARALVLERLPIHAAEYELEELP